MVAVMWKASSMRDLSVLAFSCGLLISSKSVSQGSNFESSLHGRYPLLRVKLDRNTMYVCNIRTINYLSLQRGLFAERRHIWDKEMVDPIELIE